MKKRILISSIMIVLFSICYSDVTLEKLVEYPTSGGYFEKDYLCVHEQYLFAASSYGLEIYEVEPNTPAQLISRLPLKDDTRVAEVKDDYAYVQAISWYEDHTMLYKINITDVNNPYVTDSIYTDNENGYAQGDIYNDFIILKNWDEGYNFYYSIYRIPELEFVQNYYCNYVFWKLTDSLALKRYSGNIFTLYDFSDLENITEIGQVDFSAGGIPIDHIQPVNDSILACLGFEGIAFWNYSDNRNWQYLSTVYSPSDEDWGRYLYTFGDFVFVIYIPTSGSGYPGVKSIDISDIYSPYIVDEMSLSYCDCSTCNDIDGIGNSVFLGNYHQMHQFVFDNGYFEEQFDIYENYQQKGGIVHNNYLYVSFRNGLKIYNVSSLPNVYHVNTIFEDHPLSSLQSVGNLLFFIDYTDYTIIVLDLSNPEEPIIRNEINIPPSSGTILLTNTSDFLFYKEDNPDDRLYKYSIPEPGNHTLDFQYDFNCDGKGFIYNDHFYYLAGDNPNGPDMQIYGGIEDNNPELIMTIEDFAEGYMDPPNAFIQNCGNIFYLGAWEDVRDSVRFFEIGNPTEISYKFSTHHRCHSYFCIDENYLFTSGVFSHIDIYDLETASGLTEPIADYQDYGRSLYCVIDESNGNKYLYHFQSTAFSIYEILGYGVDDEPAQNSTMITCSPNPFSTSTIISFAGKINPHESSQIKIYNVKGQLVRELKIQNLKLKIEGVVWDGKDENGKDVCAGVYLYKISNKDDYAGKLVKLQ